MKFADLLTEQHIVAGGSAGNREEAIRQLLEVLCSTGDLPDTGRAYELIMEREREYPTGLGGGVAVPHTNCLELERSLVAMGSFPAGVDFGAEDGPSTLIFLVLGSPNTSSAHLKLLARISRLAIHGLAEQVLRLSTPEELLSAVCEQEKDFLEL